MHRHPQARVVATIEKSPLAREHERFARSLGEPASWPFPLVSASLVAPWRGRGHTVGLARRDGTVVAVEIEATLAGTAPAPMRFVEAAATAGLIWPGVVVATSEESSDHALDLAVLCCGLEASGQLDASGLAGVALIGALGPGGRFVALGAPVFDAEEAADRAGLRDVVVGQPGRRFVDLLGALGAIGPLARRR